MSLQGCVHYNEASTAPLPDLRYKPLWATYPPGPPPREQHRSRKLKCGAIYRNMKTLALPLYTCAPTPRSFFLRSIPSLANSHSCAYTLRIPLTGNPLYYLQPPGCTCPTSSLSFVALAVPLLCSARMPRVVVRSPNQANGPARARHPSTPSI